MDQHDLAARQFGGMAQRYLASPVHASGADLERLTKLAARCRVSSALDLGCGAGHASFALARANVGRVVAYDLAAPMLDVVAKEAKSRGHSQIETRRGAAEHLEFADASFDLVVTRYSAHHWLDVPMALREAARIVKPGGTLVVIDVIAAETALMDTVLQTVEILRDASHVRDYRESEWRRMLMDADFSAPEVERWKLPMEFTSWIERIGTPAPRVESLKVVLDALPIEARRYFSIADDHSFAIDSAWFESTKC